ncbi:hypothetical protein UFOVP449_82 [uncultured Caudovirales phage]|uniref:Uncharacterized protein n=1 Tax=uncultured Caudovirales phage TaxID=2100421 RepID=A0A6J5MCN5_9CAUD|nr:hypothetical protein UFOVP449_82 [uncultured Caudovirales phage]
MKKKNIVVTFLFILSMSCTKNDYQLNDPTDKFTLVKIQAVHHNGYIITSNIVHVRN